MANGDGSQLVLIIQILQCCVNSVRGTESSANDAPSGLAAMRPRNIGETDQEYAAYAVHTATTPYAGCGFGSTAFVRTTENYDQQLSAQAC